MERKRTTNVFAGVEELLAVIAEKTTTHEKKKKLKKKKEVSDEDISNKKDTKNDTLRKAWEQIVPKEHFVNAMLNADVSDSRIKNANKAMAEMFKECVEMECSSTTSDAPWRRRSSRRVNFYGIVKKLRTKRTPRSTIAI